MASSKSHLTVSGKDAWLSMLGAQPMPEYQYGIIPAPTLLLLRWFGTSTRCLLPLLLLLSLLSTLLLLLWLLPTLLLLLLLAWLLLLLLLASLGSCCHLGGCRGRGCLALTLLNLLVKQQLQDSMSHASSGTHVQVPGLVP
jgi:hypothetical protein